MYVTNKIWSQLTLKCFLLKFNSPCFLQHGQISNDFCPSGSSDDILHKRNSSFCLSFQSSNIIGQLVLSGVTHSQFSFQPTALCSSLRVLMLCFICLPPVYMDSSLLIFLLWFVVKYSKFADHDNTFNELVHLGICKEEA